MNFSVAQKKIIEASDNKIICLASAAAGKALPNSTIIPTPMGNKRVDEIKEGDYLFDRLGNPTKVLGVYPQGKKTVYEVTFSDRRAARCCDEHLWSFYDTSKGNKLITKTLKEIIKIVNDSPYEYRNKKGDYRFCIPLIKGANYTKKEYNISPYDMGASLSHTENNSIPNDYLQGTILQRLELLKGILDVGGEITPLDDIHYSTINKDLSDTILQLVYSLGYKAICHKDLTNVYHIFIQCANKEKVKLFNLEEKRLKAEKLFNKEDNWSATNPIINIEKLDFKEEMTCFYVDNDEHLFATNDWCITHNTRVLTERIRNLIEVKNVEPKNIVAITFTNFAAEEMKKRLGEIANDMFIGTIHSYANKICLLGKIDTATDINKQNFDKILEKAMRVSLKNYPTVEHLLVDECQDMTPLVFNFVNKIPTNNIFLCGDTRQTIYTFNGSSDEYMKTLYYSREYKCYNLAENYRNPPNIIDYAEEFLSSNKMNEIGPKSIAIKNKNGLIEECSFNETIDLIQTDKNWGSWFVLTRTNAELDKAVEVLVDNNIPCKAFRKHEYDLDGMDEALRENTVKVMTIHASKGLQRKNVVVIGARRYNLDERRISYVAATRAESALFWCPTIVKRLAGKKKQEKVKNLTFFNGGGNGIIQF